MVKMGGHHSLDPPESVQPKLRAIAELHTCVADVRRRGRAGTQYLRELEVPVPGKQPATFEPEEQLTIMAPLCSPHSPSHSQHPGATGPVKVSCPLSGPQTWPERAELKGNPVYSPCQGVYAVRHSRRDAHCGRASKVPHRLNLAHVSCWRQREGDQERLGGGNFVPGTGVMCLCTSQTLFGHPQHALAKNLDSL